MVAVAILAVSFGLVGHVQRVIQSEARYAGEDGDFWPAILYIEGVFLAILLGSALAIRSIIRFARRDDAYARQLRRDVPVDFTAISPNRAANGVDVESSTNHHA